jgi:adenylate kinase
VSEGTSFKTAREGRVVVIMGPPNAGKDTQAHLLAEGLGGHMIGSGELIRTEADPRLLEIMARGDLIPEADFSRLIAQAIEKVPLDKPVVMAGITKKPGEALWLTDYLPSIGRWLDRVIYLNLSQDLSAHRSGNRGKGRDDDHPGVQERRWHRFFTETAQSLAYFRSLDLLVDVEGSGTVEQVAAEIDEVLSH